MNKIALLDCGSQFAHLLANRIRRLGVYSEILDAETPASELTNYKGIIISGGPASVTDPNSPKIDPEILKLGIPILGVCYGHQAILQALGGTIQKGEVGEYGLTTFTVKENKGVLKNLCPGTNYQIYASHFDLVSKLPEGFESIGKTADDPNSATVNLERKIFTLQFHPEVTHTECGMEILDSFLEITEAKRDWSTEKFIEEELKSIIEKVGDKKVFLLISGGVDSSVTYALLAKAIGADRIFAMYVDTGLMRKGETKEIQKFLSGAGVKGLRVEDASQDFISALKDKYDPEEKRQIIGNKFLEIQRRVAAELKLNPDEWLLGQGTIYPDTVESGGTKNAAKIKTHHNRVPEIEEMIKQGKIIEPIKELYKDEVRMVGRTLGLPDTMIQRHPFPGPGLGVRCLCLRGPEGEFKQVDIQNFTAHQLPIKSVGVQGDERTYRHPLVLEGEHNWATLRTISPQITNSNSEVNRVLFLAAGGPITSATVTPSYITKSRLDLLREADALVAQALPGLDPDNLVWQFPTVLIPLSINSQSEESIILRPISSTNVMTANFTELPWEKVQALAQKILKLPGISTVFYDITNKPPGTIEWE